MELDVNKEAHDLVWRLMSPDCKKRYLENFGSLKTELLHREITRFIEVGYLRQESGDVVLTAKGKELHQQLTRKGCCQPG